MKNKRYVITSKGAAIVLTFCITASSAFGFAGGMATASLGDAAGSLPASALKNSMSTAADLASLTDTVSSDAGTALSVSDVASLTANSVVEITTETVTTDSWMQQYITNGAGSGVIISQDGYIMTNNHVIDGANKITVRLKSEKTYTATLIGTDSESDVALLKIDAAGLTPVVFGDSDSLKVGDTAIAIGNPLGELGGTVTEGIISALDRELVIDGKTMTLLQTDAAINPGNSGGGLFNAQGELVGLVVAKSSGSDVEGLGFAIPANVAKNVAGELKQYGYVKGRIDTGMTFIDLTSTQKALLYGVGQRGIYIKSVETGSNAAAAGFKTGDLVKSVGSTQITSAAELTQAFEECQVGDTVKITVIRASQTLSLSLKLAEYTPN